MKIDRVPEKFINEIVAPFCNNDERIKQAFRDVPRHKFIDEALSKIAYQDNALPIGFGQTISKPSTVAYMTSILNTNKDEKILEIGTGSGFQAGIISKLCRSVYTVERIPALYHKSSGILRKLHLPNIHFKIDNGKIGWKEHAPFDKIIVTAGGDMLPEELAEQLHLGGVLVMPLKNRIKFCTKSLQGLVWTDTERNCKFVEFVM